MKYVYLMLSAAPGRRAGTYLKYGLLLLLATVTQAAFAQGPPQVWTKQLGGTAFENTSAWCPTADGGYLIGGTSTSGISGDKTENSRGGQDYWVVKLNASGTKVWDKRFGGTGSDILKKIITTSDGNFILAGSSNSGIGGDKTEVNRYGANPDTYDYWLVKINASGTKVWDKTYGGGLSDMLGDLTENSDGSLLIGGSSSSRSGPYEKTENPRTNPASPAVPPTDYWVVKINSSGTKQWDKTYGGAGVVADKTGVEVLAGIQKLSDGGYLIAGYSNSNTGSEKSDDAYDDGNDPDLTHYDYWVLKINSTGTKVWDKTYGGNEADKLFDLKAGDNTDQFLLVGSSRSANTGNKTNSPVISSDVAEHIWALKINCAGSTQGTILFSRTYQGRAGVRNYFHNISADTKADGYYISLHARDRDGTTNRLDKYNWAGTKLWSKALSDTSHYQTNRKLYQVLNTSFDTMKLEPQTRKLYNAFLNGYNAKTFSPPLDDAYFSKEYTDKINLYGMRGPKNYQNYIKQFLEEGISDPRLIQIVYELAEPIASRFETANALWPPGIPLPGATNASGIVIDQYSADYNQAYNASSTDLQSAARRRKVWNGGVVNNSHPWGQSPTIQQRKSPFYKDEETTNTSSRKRLLYLSEKTQDAGLNSYGTLDHRLDLQLGSEYILWAGYILDVNRHLDPDYGTIADAIWEYKNDWEVDANRVFGNRENTTAKNFPNAHALHHANAALTSVFHCFVEWEKLRNGAPRAKDVSALEYQIATILDDFYPVNVPSTAPDYNKFIGAQIQNFSHFNNPTRVAQGNAAATGPGDTTYEIEFSPILANLKKSGYTDGAGNKIDDATFEALSNMHALIIEQPTAKGTGGKWAIPNSVVQLKNGGSSAKLNNDAVITGFQYGGSSGVDWQTVGARRPNGGTYLAYDKSGRQFNLFQLRGKSHDGTAERFDVANILADPNHSNKQSWHWLQAHLLLKLRKPDFDIATATYPNPLLDLTNEDSKGFVYVSDNNQVFELNTKTVSATNTDYQVVRNGVYAQTLQTEDATSLSHVSIQTTHAGYTGTGYGYFARQAGTKTITWNYTPDFTGNVAIKFRYSNDTDATGVPATQYLKLEVGSTVVSNTYPFPNTAGWTDWQNTAAHTFAVTAGTTYVIKLSSTAWVPKAEVDAMIAEVLQAPDLQAEQAQLGNGAELSSLYNTNATYDPGAQGSSDPRYAALPNTVTGDYVEWKFYKANAGNVNLNFRYANGDASNRPLKLEINGSVITPAPTFPPSGGWNTWINQSVSATLTAGDNVVRLSTTGTKGPNLDRLSYTSSVSPNPIMSTPEALAAMAQPTLPETPAMELSVVAYPNPATGVVKVVLQNGSAGAVNIQFVSIAGSVVKRMAEQLDSGNGEFMVSISDLSPGLYVVHAAQSQGSASVKLYVK